MPCGIGRSTNVVIPCMESLQPKKSWIELRPYAGSNSTACSRLVVCSPRIMTSIQFTRRTQAAKQTTICRVVFKGEDAIKAVDRPSEREPVHGEALILGSVRSLFG